MNRYSKTNIRINKDNIRYRRNVIFPEIPETLDDLYVITSAGDRYDSLALTYYKDPGLWWLIAGANNSQKDSLVVEPGVQLRIPMNISEVLRLYNDLNNDR